MSNTIPGEFLSSFSQSSITLAHHETSELGSSQSKGRRAEMVWKAQHSMQRYLSTSEAVHRLVEGFGRFALVGCNLEEPEMWRSQKSTDAFTALLNCKPHLNV